MIANWAQTAAARVTIIPYDQNDASPSNPLDRYFDPPRSIPTIALTVDKVELDLSTTPIEVDVDDLPDPTVKTLEIYMGNNTEMVASNIGSDPAQVPLDAFLAAVYVYSPVIELPPNSVYRLKKIGLSFETSADAPGHN